MNFLNSQTEMLFLSGYFLQQYKNQIDNKNPAVIRQKRRPDF